MELCCIQCIRLLQWSALFSHTCSITIFSMTITMTMKNMLLFTHRCPYNIKHIPVYTIYNVNNHGSYLLCMFHRYQGIPPEQHKHHPQIGTGAFSWSLPTHGPPKHTSQHHFYAECWLMTLTIGMDVWCHKDIQLFSQLAIIKFNLRPKGSQSGECQWPFWSSYKGVCVYKQVNMHTFQASAPCTVFLNT